MRGRKSRWGRGARRGSGEPFVRPRTQCHFHIVTWRREMRTDAILSRPFYQMPRNMYCMRRVARCCRRSSGCVWRIPRENGAKREDIEAISQASPLMSPRLRCKQSIIQRQKREETGNTRNEPWLEIISGFASVLCRCGRGRGSGRTDKHSKLDEADSRKLPSVVPKKEVSAHWT